jgi:hypothetical protein
LSQEEEIQAEPIDRTRRLLGYMLIVVNLPLMLLKLYEVYLKYIEGYPWTQTELILDVVILVINIVFVIYLPRVLPLYPSKYVLGEKGVKLSRFMRPNTIAEYKYMIRAELYIPKKGRIDENKNLEMLARTQLNDLRNSGFSQQDFTNDMKNVVLLISGNAIYALSPAYPRAFLNKLRKRKSGLPAKQIEVRKKGRRETDI